MRSMTQHIISHVREHVGPVAAFKLVIFVPALPKTRSGKIARATLAALADGKSFKVSKTHRVSECTEGRQLQLYFSPTYRYHPH